MRADPADPSPSAHRRVLLKQAVKLQGPTDVLVMDREFTVGQVQAAGATAWVTRLLKNVTARRANPPAYGGGADRRSMATWCARWRDGARDRRSPRPRRIWP